jgi:pimeloyl-ACP methyl ester carboxylesterase
MSATTRAVRGIEMSFDERGGDGGATVVLLHGFPFNHTMWREQVEALTSDGYRVITPDLRGHGGTGLVGEVSSMEEMARDVAALLDELNISEPVILAGLSMGGYVTLAFRRLFPERVRALVLADTRPQADTEEGRRVREQTARRALSDGMEAVADAMMPKLFPVSARDEKPEVVARVREMVLATDPRGAAAALRGMAARRDQTDLLPDIDVPTLIVVGSEDTITPPADSETMHRSIRGSRLEVIEGAGHVSNMERPDVFNRALKDFLKAVVT